MIRQCSQLIRAGAFTGLFFAGIYAVNAADVTSYSVRKGMIYEQSSTATPTLIPFQSSEFIARVDGNVDAITGVQLAAQSSVFPIVDLDKAADHFEYVVTLPDQGTLDSFYQTGDYAFTINPGNTVATLDLQPGAYPTAIPQVVNYT